MTTRTHLSSNFLSLKCNDFQTQLRSYFTWILPLLLAVLILLSSATRVQAEKPHLLTVGAGLAGVLDTDREDIIFGVLEYRLEFKSFLEVAYRLTNDSRIGLRGSHLSNAGFGDRNPGADSLSLLYSHPF